MSPHGSVRVGIIGAGKIADRHIAAYKQLGGVELTIADVDAAVAGRKAERFGLAAAPVRDLLADPALDAVDVCTPVRSHKELIVEALGRGKHVFCEKPLCLDVAEAEEILAATRAARRIVMVGYLYRFHPAFEMVKQWLDQQLIGAPHLGIFRIGGRGGHRAWKHTRSEGGGALNEMLIHKLDLALWFLGGFDDLRVHRVETLLPRRVIEGKERAADAEDYVLLELSCGGANIVCEGDLVSPGYMSYLELHGDNGSIFASMLHYLPTILFLKESRGIFNQGNSFYSFPQVDLFGKEIGHFVTCLRTSSAHANSVEDSIEVLRVVEQIRERTAAAAPAKESF